MKQSPLVNNFKTMGKTVFRICKRGAAILVCLDDGYLIPRQTSITIKQDVDDMKFNRALVEWESFVWGPELNDKDNWFYSDVLSGVRFDGLISELHEVEDFEQRLAKLNFKFKAYAFISGETYNANLQLKEI